MKNKSKRIMISLIIFIVASSIIFVVMFAKRNIKNSNDNNVQASDNYYIELNDGYKQNVSSKISEKRQIDGLDITNATIIYINENCRIKLNIENNTNEKKGDFIVNIKILDDKCNTMINLSGYIAEILPGSSTEANIDSEYDFSNAYDYEIIKK